MRLLFFMALGCLITRALPAENKLPPLSSAITNNFSEISTCELALLNFHDALAKFAQARQQSPSWVEAVQMLDADQTFSNEKESQIFSLAAENYDLFNNPLFLKAFDDELVSRGIKKSEEKTLFLKNFHALPDWSEKLGILRLVLERVVIQLPNFNSGNVKTSSNYRKKIRSIPKKPYG